MAHMASKPRNAETCCPEDATAGVSTRPSFLERDLHSEPAPSAMIPRIPTPIPTPIPNRHPGDKHSQGKRPGHGSPETSTDRRQADLGSFYDESDVNSTAAVSPGREIPIWWKNRFADPGGSQSPVPKEATVIHINPLVPQDVTVHISLPLRDDLTCALEDFSRMRRLGRFREALELFDDLLAHSLDNQYVLVQYGLCLYDGGHMAKLLELAQKHPPSSSPKGALLPLQLCWIILHSVAEAGPLKVQQNKNATDILMSAVIPILNHSWPHLSSVEVQMIVLMFRFVEYSRWVDDLPSDWSNLYRHLVAEGMVWEFSDVFHCLITTHSPESLAGSMPGLASTSYQAESALQALLLPHQKQSQGVPEDPFDCLCRDWEEEVQDESTWFALLNIFTTIALISCRNPKRQDGAAQRCMALAGERATKLVAQDENNALSRPYLRWTMAKLLTGPLNDTNEQSVVSRGFAFGQLTISRPTFPDERLPVYIPATFDPEETAQWQPKPTKDGGESERNKIRTVIQAAEELGDIELQSGCLCTMLLSGLEPSEFIVDRLTSLWTSAGNLTRLPELCLFRYMLASTPATREQLRRDLLCYGEVASSVMQEARYKILAILSPDDHDKENYRRWAMELALRPRLGPKRGRSLGPARPPLDVEDEWKARRPEPRNSLPADLPTASMHRRVRSRITARPHDGTVSFVGGDRQWPVERRLTDVASCSTPPPLERTTKTKDNTSEKLDIEGIYGYHPPSHTGSPSTSYSPGSGKGARRSVGLQKQATVDDYEGSSDEHRGRPKASDIVAEPGTTSPEPLLLEYGRRNRGDSDSGTDDDDNDDILNVDSGKSNPKVGST